MSDEPESWSGPILTLAELRRRTAHLPGDTHVVIAKQGLESVELDDWYLNTSALQVPDGTEDSQWQCVTLFPGSEFDSWQL